MKIIQNASLLPFNTFKIDVNADMLIEYSSVNELREIFELYLKNSKKYLHIGSGSNLLFLNDFKGIILHSLINEIKITENTHSFVLLEVGAGVVWDDLVEYVVENDWSGVENLSLIPGEVGAAAVQNIGAYGVEIKDVIEHVNAIEIETGIQHVFSNEMCNYAYRDSIFKNKLKDKFIITSVVFKLDKCHKYKLSYQHLEEDIRKNGELNLDNIRKTIISVRESKLPDPKVIGNAGSFFMNPVIDRIHFDKLLLQYPQMPHYHVSENEEKVPAGWLIEQCGWKGKQLGMAAVHDKQALVIINKGGATVDEIVFLAQQIQESVEKMFKIKLTPEVNYI